MNCKICTKLIDEEYPFSEELEMCGECWIKDQSNKYNDKDKIKIADKLLEFYFSGYQPDFKNGEEWEYDGSTRDLWAELVDMIGDEVEWD